jgi:hypothetical protein
MAMSAVDGMETHGFYGIDWKKAVQANQRSCIALRKAWSPDEYPEAEPMTESTPHLGQRAVPPSS